MFYILRKAGDILRTNFLFIQPLMVCLLFDMLAFSYIMGRKNFGIPQIILLICITLFTICFTAGCLYINKLAVQDYNPDDSIDNINQKSINNFRKFFEGIGSNVIKTTLTCIILFLIYTATIFLISKTCLNTIGEPKIVHEFQNITKATTQAEIANILNSIPDIDKMVFSAWILIFNVVFSILNYFGVLYLTFITFNNDNIFKSLFKTIKFFFCHILESLFIIIIAFALYIGICLCPMIFGSNLISAFIFTILFTMYLNYYLLLVFCLYYDKTKDNSNNRTECFGENETCN